MKTWQDLYQANQLSGGPHCKWEVQIYMMLDVVSADDEPGIPNQRFPGSHHLVMLFTVAGGQADGHDRKQPVQQPRGVPA